jgi:hypothetical protein
VSKREKRERDRECLNSSSPFQRLTYRLKDSSISRYKAEFKEISLIGSGEHGAVFKCRNRLGKYDATYDLY